MFNMKFNETYRQIEKIPRLQSAHINFNNWILCLNKSCQTPLEIALPPWVLALPPWCKKNQPPAHFFNFSSP